MRTLLILSLVLPVKAFSAPSSSVVASAAFGSLDSVPVLKCPAVPEAYSKMITQLTVLKAAIKKDASCEPIQSEVASLQDLLGKRRDEVRGIIEKSKKESLSDEELSRIKAYVEDVTKKVLSTAELFQRNNTCFLEDKKNISFGDLASITLDATALAKTIAGPWATPISLSGQALAGIFQGLNSVIGSRRGYDFTKLEQRQSYVQSLCAYYNYRQDIEYLLYPERRVRQLKKLESALAVHLNAIVSNCSECAELARKVMVSYQADSSGSSRTRPPKRNQDLNVQAEKVNESYVQPLGTDTLRTLSTLRWINSEVVRIRAEAGEDSTIGRDLLSEVKADLDRFLFEREAPAFLQFQAQKTFDLYRDFRSFVMGEGDRLQAQSFAFTKSYKSISTMNEAEVVQYVSSLQPQLRTAGQAGLASRVSDFETRSVDYFERIRISAGVGDTYCGFFQKAGVYNSSIQIPCEGMLMNAVKRNMKRISESRYVPMSIPSASADLFFVDWVDSMFQGVQLIDGEFDRYRKKSPATRP